MAANYSNEYMQLMKEISKSYSCTHGKVSEAFLVNDNEDKIDRISIVVTIIVILAIVCAISSVFHLIFASIISALNILMIFIFLLILAGFVIFVPFIIESIFKPILELKKGDEIFYNQEKTCHCAVAGYFYYSAHIRGNKSASKRLEMLLKTPELLSFFSINGLAENSKEKNHQKTFLGIEIVYIEEYRAFVTEYYGDRLQKPKEYALFYETNAKMFSNQIFYYDKLKNETHYEIENLDFGESDLYSKARDCHYKWYMGDESNRILFKKLYLNDVVLKKHQEHIKKLNEETDYIFSRSDDSLTFDHLMNSVVNNIK
ncbi:MAG: hypothetical protein IJD97_03040 [Clostridia bacterium]|nr:hypothetical protein [Clostridia bacterium]